jgi:hypothetical protein
MTGWEDLDAELDRWAKLNLRAELWWRDDDATVPSPALDQLLVLRRELDVPLSLAVIPARAEQSLKIRLAGETQVAVLQHGYAHVNHAPAGSKKCELTESRPMAETMTELAKGCTVLENWSGFIPVLVPPWNRIAPNLIGRLPGQGFRGLSGFGAISEWRRDLVQVNTHLDPIAWCTDRGFLGLEPALRSAIAELEGRRTGTQEHGEPIGLLTHHAAHVESVWSFVAEFLTRTRDHPGARWVSARELFGVAA